jgi:predicted HTH transcriptional regulator
MSVANLCDHIRIGEEDPRREYKAPMSWANNLTRAKITKSILAMSNIRDGGVIVIGIQEGSDKKFEAVGVSQAEASTFTHGDIASHVKEYADPHAEFTVRQIECDGKRFVCIQVKEFDDLPVICKKDGVDLERGRIYTRPRTKNESSPVSSYSEMREILDMAADKAVRKFLSRLPGPGALPSQGLTVKFADQRKDLP